MATTIDIASISKERKEVIQKLAPKSNKNPRFEHPSDDEAALLDRLDVLLTRLGDVQMTPEIKEKPQIHRGMEVISSDKYKFPEDYVVRAKSLLEKWEGENWGAPVAVKRGSGSEPESDGEANDNGNQRINKKRKPSESTGKEGAKLLLPKPDHPIWGLNGIMHGICYSKSNGRKSPQLDPRYKNKQRRADVVGKNKLTVGAWFPCQLSALFNGAHGSAQGGIYGNASSGAYSIIVSGQYDDLDSDHGNYLFYSGSGSRSNEDPKNPPPSTAGTNALKTSLETQQPVRVLRNATGKSRWAPTRGIRNDGLYVVESMKTPLNAKGGKFESFRLVRLQDQDDINQARPSAREVRDFDRITEPFLPDTTV